MLPRRYAPQRARHVSACRQRSPPAYVACRRAAHARRHGMLYGTRRHKAVSAARVARWICGKAILRYAVALRAARCRRRRGVAVRRAAEECEVARVVYALHAMACVVAAPSVCRATSTAALPRYASAAMHRGVGGGGKEEMRFYREVQQSGNVAR